MRRSGGKIRAALIALLSATAFLDFGLHGSRSAYGLDSIPSFLVTDRCSEAVTAYSAVSNGDVSPLFPVPTGLSEPQFLASDKNGNAYVTNSCNGTITIFGNGSNGSAAPFATIAVNNAGTLNGIALDDNGKIYVADGAEVSVYPALKKKSVGLLNETPIAVLTGSNTGLQEPTGVALDSSGRIYVADFMAGSLFVYAALGKRRGLLKDAPIATIAGSNTNLIAPWGVALDSSRNIYVSDNGASSVFIYPALGKDHGPLNEAPTATISGSDTGLEITWGIAVDTNGNIYVADWNQSSVFVYPPVASSTGQLNEVPSATISGANTGMIGPDGLFVDSSSNIHVADFYADSVSVFPAGSSGNIPPSSGTIGTTTAIGLNSPRGIALDPSGNIYVADCPVCYGYPGNPGVFVYSAGSNGNTAPSAIISGPNTDLSAPEGIALDSSSNLYVMDVGSSPITPKVFVYPARSNGNVVPSATISGTSTGLEDPSGIALDSNNNIYVIDSDGACDSTVKVLIYAAKSDGDVAPIATLSGRSTGLCGPTGIALDSSDKIYVADNAAQSVFIYPPLGGSTGLLNEAPSAIISGSSTGLSEPYGIALDSAADVYVTNGGEVVNNLFVPGGVLVFSAGSGGNVAPIRTIAGPQTQLADPLFIALPPGAVVPTPVPVMLKISPTSLNFGTIEIGKQTRPKPIIVSNPKGGKKRHGLTVTMQEVGGGISPFSETDDCDAPLPAGEMCTIKITFMPTATGSQSEALMIIDNAENEPQLVWLYGSGTVAREK
jgi:sugar lactone lactonase YvrE